MMLDRANMRSVVSVGYRSWPPRRFAPAGDRDRHLTGGVDMKHDSPRVEWSAPPTPRRNRWADWAVVLRIHAGDWAKIGEVDPDEAHLARQGLKRHGCEVATRTVVSGRVIGVWARWSA